MSIIYFIRRKITNQYDVNQRNDCTMKLWLQKISERKVIPIGKKEVTIRTLCFALCLRVDIDMRTAIARQIEYYNFSWLSYLRWWSRTVSHLCTFDLHQLSFLKESITSSQFPIARRVTFKTAWQLSRSFWRCKSS